MNGTRRVWRIAFALALSLTTAATRAQPPAGINPQMRYLSEVAANLTGGDAQKLRETGELDIGAHFDMARLVGIRGGTFQATISWRRGDNLARDAGLDTLELVQANYGRGQTARLTQFWYQQEFLDGRADVKFGRVTAGEDFAAFSCDFMNLGLCGARPGSVVSDYWYNWPISQWAVRMRYRGPSGYVQVGALEVNPKNLEENFTLGRFSGATGVLVPFEVAFTPNSAFNQPLGIYKLGGWYDSSTVDGIDITGESERLSALPDLQRQGRYGAYAQIRQQLTGRDNATRTSGLAIFLNIVQAEQRTSHLDRQIGFGVTYQPLQHSGAPEELALGLTSTRVNPRFASRERQLHPEEPRLASEYVAEFYGRWNLTPWLWVQPNVQYIVSPGGHSKREDVAIVGLRLTTALE